MSISIVPPYKLFPDRAGQPLESGYLYIGEANLNAEVHPIAVYWDEDLTVLAAQPIRTMSGYANRNGTPSNIYAATDYSITVRDRNGSLVYSAPSKEDNLRLQLAAPTGAGLIGTLASAFWSTVQGFITYLISSAGSSIVGFIQAGTGAVARTVQDKNREIVSVFDFMTSAQIADVQANTYLIDCTAAIQAACNATTKLYVPNGGYLLSNTISISNKAFSLIGGGIDTTIFRWAGVGMTGLNGITYTNTLAQVQFMMEDITLLTVISLVDAHVYGGVGLSIAYPNQLSVQSPTVHLTRVHIRPAYNGPTWGITTWDGWTTCLLLQDAGGVKITDCLFAGDFLAPINTIKGVVLVSNTGNPDGVFFDKCSFIGLSQGMYCSGPASIGGIVFDACNFGSCNIGIDVSIASDMIQITDSYFLVYGYGVKANTRTTKVNTTRFDLVVDARGLYLPAYAEGITLGIGTSPLDAISVLGCAFDGTGVIAKNGVRLTSGVTNALVSNNTFGAISTYGTVYGKGIIIDSGANNNVITNNISTNCTQLVIDSGSNNIIRDNTAITELRLPLTGAIPSLKSSTKTINNILYLTQSGATNVTDFTNGFLTQEIFILFGDALSTIVNSASIRLAGGINYNPTASSMLKLIYDGTQWRETGRVVA